MSSAITLKTFNRTIVELKQSDKERGEIRHQAFNRTIVELKPNRMLKLTANTSLLIVP